MISVTGMPLPMQRSLRPIPSTCHWNSTARLPLHFSNTPFVSIKVSLSKELGGGNEPSPGIHVFASYCMSYSKNDHLRVSRG